MNAYTTINLNAITTVNDPQFEKLCLQNPELILERNKKGELIIMSPTGGETGKKNAELIVEFGIWNRQKKLGLIFDSSTCFRLPIGSNRSPDVAYIQKQRWEKLTPEERIKFPPIAPDFVLELMSDTDSLTTIQEKMEEYKSSGVKLGWLINPEAKQVEVYRQGKEKEVLNNPHILSEEEILPDFNLDLNLIWE